MSKTRKRKNQKQARRPASHSLSQQSSGSLVTRDRGGKFKTVRATLYRLNDVDRLIGLAAAIGTVILQATISKRFVDSHPYANFILATAFTTISLILLVTYLWQNVLGRKNPLTMTEQWVKRWFRVKMSLSIFMLSIVVFLIIYVLGVVDVIYDYIRAHWSGASNWVVNAISTTLSLIFSGVVGNFAYDLLKRIVLRKKKS